MAKKAKNGILQAETISLTERIIEPKHDQIVGQLLAVLGRTIPVAVIDAVDANKSPAWNHKAHRGLVLLALKDTEYIATDYFGRSTPGFSEPALHYDKKVNSGMHVDGGKLKELTWLSVHTSENRSRVIFTDTALEDTVTRDFAGSHELFQQGKYDSFLTGRDFYTGVLEPGQSTIFRASGAFPTVHYFETVGANLRDFYVSQTWVKQPDSLIPVTS